MYYMFNINLEVVEVIKKAIMFAYGFEEDKDFYTIRGKSNGGRPNK